MKKYLGIIFTVTLMFSFLSFNGCILDALNSNTVNMPYTKHIELSGITTSISKSESFDISQSNVYKKYKDKINSITFVKAEFRTTSVKPENITGDITVKLEDKNGKTIFSKEIKNVAPADFIKKPFELSLTQKQ